MAKKKEKCAKDYAHNPRYSMISPDAAHPDEDDIVPTGKS